MPARAPSTNPSRCRALAAALLAALLAGCAAGPDYVRPRLDLPPAYKESGPWKTAEPRAVDAQHPWWELYRDTTLNGLIDEAGRANQNIRQAEAQYRQARAVAAEAHAAFWPSFGGAVGASRARSNSNGLRLGNDVNAGLNASWEPDLWGSVRRAIEADNAGAQASADDLAGARLSIQAELAQDYLQLRVIDLQRDLYAATIAAYARALRLTQSQYAAGGALRSDVALAESQLKTVQAQGGYREASRSQIEHAIAILLGKTPAAFALAPVALTVAQLQARLPAIPTGLPSALLERRPDIAGAERRVALANANIGVAQAAFFPALVLNASGGFNGAALASLFDTPSRVWSLGATLAQTLFDGGLRRARSDAAIAVYDAAVAQYKQTVLGGFQQVEDNLAILRVLDQESELQDDAVQASQLAERSALSQYRAGTASYIAVVTAQTLALANQRSATQIVGRQLAAIVALITATGGGWSAADPVVAARAAEPAAEALARAERKQKANR